MSPALRAGVAVLAAVVLIGGGALAIAWSVGRPPTPSTQAAPAAMKRPSTAPEARSRAGAPTVTSAEAAWDRRIAATAAALAGAAIVASLVAGRLVGAPMRALRRDVESVTRADDPSLDVGAQRGELERLAMACRTLVGRLRASRDEQHRLIADAGHELRTPLTSLRTNVEVLGGQLEGAGNPLSDGQRRKLVAQVTAQVAELGVLVDDLLELTAEKSHDEPTVALFLNDIVADQVTRVRRRAGAAVRIETTLAPVSVRGRRHALARAVVNLLDNAVKWSPPGGRVEVLLAVDGARTVLTVADRGPGIPEPDLERVFDRFYRVRGARRAQGFGLGLSIVRRTVESHGGEAWMARREGGGTLARIALPLRSG